MSGPSFHDFRVTKFRLITYLIRSIVQLTASQKRSSIRKALWRNLKPLFLSPQRFLVSRPTRLLFAVYFGTYTTANTIDTVHNATQNATIYSIIPAATLKLLGVTTISTGLTVYKDSRLAQMFGAANSSSLKSNHSTGQPSSSTIQPIRTPRVPYSAYTLFTLRDILTIYSCIVLPPILSQNLEQFIAKKKWEGENFSSQWGSPTSRGRIIQLTLPALLQFVTTPVHLLALDLNNRQQRLSVFDRAQRVGRDVGPAIVTRMMRIVPAFGIGGIINSEVKTRLPEYLVFGQANVVAEDESLI